MKKSNLVNQWSWQPVRKYFQPIRFRFWVKIRDHFWKLSKDNLQETPFNGDKSKKKKKTKDRIRTGLKNYDDVIFNHDDVIFQHDDVISHHYDVVFVSYLLKRNYKMPTDSTYNSISYNSTVVTSTTIVATSSSTPWPLFLLINKNTDVKRVFSVNHY